MDTVVKDTAEKIEIDQGKNRVGLLNQLADKIDRDRLKQSYEDCLDAIELAENSGYKEGVCLAYANASDLALKRGFYEEACRYGEEALACQHQLGSQMGIAEESINLGRVYLHLNKLTRAEELFQYAVSIATSLEMLPLEADATQALAELYETKGQLAESVAAYKKFISLRETLLDTRLIGQLSKAQTIYQLKAKAREAETYRVKTDELELTVSQRTAELQEALDDQQALQFQLTESLARLRESLSFKSSIIEGVAHEFRTPLTVIKTSLDLMIEFRSSLTPDREKILLARIDHSINRINRTISDVQTVNRLDLLTVDYSPEDFDLLNVFQGVFAKFTEDRDRIWLEQDISAELLQVSLSRYFVQSIIIRLVENALQFSAKESHVTIGIKYQENKIHIIVKDNGIGIPKDEHDQIFKSFYRASNSGTKGGLGLGLTIAQSYAHAMNGEISVLQSEKNKGTTMLLELPRIGQPR